MSHLQLTIYCEPKDIEILSALLFDFGATGTNELENGFESFFNQDEFSKKDVMSYLGEIHEGRIIDYTFQEIEPTNWNQLWESNYDPIEVDNFCYVHAPFHEVKAGFKHTIRINPRMAFGTGHHETTFLMMKVIEEIDLVNQSILDLGCGSGILAILAVYEGASKALAVDIDPNAVETLEENFLVNNTMQIVPKVGTIDDVIEEFDVIFANINRNVLTTDAEKICNQLKLNGLLVLSGFYKHDLDLMTKTYANYGLNHKKVLSKNSWVSVIFKKEIIE